VIDVSRLVDENAFCCGAFYAAATASVTTLSRHGAVGRIGMFDAENKMNFVSTLIVQVLTSATVLGLFVFVVKNYVEKWLAREFEKRRLSDQHALTQQFKVAEAFLQQQLGIYPEIIELVYRLRNGLRDSLRAQSPQDWSPQVHDLFEHLSDNLYKYRLFITDDVFRKLHRFKVLCKDAVDLQARHASGNNLFRSEDYVQDIHRFESRWREIDALYAQITDEVRRDLSERQEGR
jgi:hypothetical protein